MMSPERQRVHAALHYLWTKYATHSRPHYVKAEWLELDQAIEALDATRRGPPPVDPEPDPTY